MFLYISLLGAFALLVMRLRAIQTRNEHSFAAHVYGHTPHKTPQCVSAAPASMMVLDHVIFSTDLGQRFRILRTLRCRDRRTDGGALGPFVCRKMSIHGMSAVRSLPPTPPTSVEGFLGKWRCGITMAL
ncbi:hypothetical protein L210DRAFT_2657303 [Boletus edulis BED1]|uniref:Secreted protein n=1 Tax=Boletus edulis BED1 TaxID=1328754 RepID=A0AAD4C666_BOLED|nr:hypothetical protein L210DRAFT_2657303 [Boletus edulis BED1]